MKTGCVVLLVIMTVGAVALKADIKEFIIGFTVVFWISYICWILGSWANIAVTTPPDMKKFGITRSLKLTAEAGFIIALLVGLFFGNFVPDQQEHRTPARLTAPMMRIGETLVQCAWEDALSVIATNLNLIKNNRGPKSIGCLALGSGNWHQCLRR